MNDAHVTRVEDVFENGVDLVLFRRDVLHVNRVGGVESARGEVRCEVDVTNAATAEATRHASQLANTTLNFGVELKERFNAVSALLGVLLTQMLSNFTTQHVLATHATRHGEVL